MASENPAKPSALYWAANKLKAKKEEEKKKAAR